MLRMTTKVYGLDLTELVRDPQKHADAKGLSAVLKNSGISCNMDLESASLEDILSVVDDSYGTDCEKEYSGIPELIKAALGKKGVSISCFTGTDQKSREKKTILGIPYQMLCDSNWTELDFDDAIDAAITCCKMVFPDSGISFGEYPDGGIIFKEYLLENTGRMHACNKDEALVHIGAEDLHIALKVFDESLSAREDIISAVKAACQEYVQTKDGMAYFDYLCGCFHWDDVVHVPNFICRKYGFEIVEIHEYELIVDHKEMLVDF